MQENINELFANENDRINAINALAALQAQEGWILIQRILEIQIKAREQQILNDDELSAEHEKELKQDRLRFIYFRDLPKDQILSLTNPPTEQQEDPDDPFDKAPIEEEDNQNSA